MSSISGSNASNTTVGDTIALGSAADRRTEVADYFAAVRAALADLEPVARDGLLEDLSEHLSEVAAADSAPLRSRLGTPERFAADLRSAAGLPNAADAPETYATGGSPTEVARALLVRADRSIGRLCGYRTLHELLVDLRPGWWLVRGVAIVVALLTVSGVMSPGYNPAVFRAFLLLALLGAALSCRFGRAVQRAQLDLRTTAVVVNLISSVAIVYSWYEYLRPW